GSRCRSAYASRANREYEVRLTTFKPIIVGGGMVAGHLGKGYVEKGGRSWDLAIVSAEDALPYERPPLSKGFLAGKDSEESVLISPPDFYDAHGINVRRNSTVASIDAQRKLLHTVSGEEFAFEKLVLSTGARVRTLDVPGASSE